MHGCGKMICQSLAQDMNHKSNFANPAGNAKMIFCLVDLCCLAPEVMFLAKNNSKLPRFN